MENIHSKKKQKVGYRFVRFLILDSGDNQKLKFYIYIYNKYIYLYILYIIYVICIIYYIII